MFLRNTTSRSVRQLRLPRAPRQNPAQSRNSRRGYANASDAANKAREGAEKAKHGAQSMLRGELPWALGATLVTVPTTYMILANGSHGEDAGYPGDKWHGSEDHDEEEHEEEDGGGEGEQDEAEAGEKGKEDEEKADGGDEKDGGGKEKSEGDDEQEKGEAQNEEEANKADEDKSKDGGDRSQLKNPEKDDKSGDDGGDEKEGDHDQEDGGDDNKEGGDDKQQDGGEEKSNGGDEQSEGKDDKYADSSKGSDIKRSEGKNVSEQPAKNELSKKTKSGEDAKWTDTVELENEGSDSKKIHKPDAKGGAKRRIESSYGNKLGHTDTDVPESHATSGQEAKEGSITKKTVGLSNTETKHSIDIANDPEKSKKGDGTPETAKSMGTIDARKSSVR